MPSREVHERSTAGTWQVSQRSAETSAGLGAGSSVAGRCTRPAMRGPAHGPAAGRGSAMKRHGARQRSSATVQGDPPRSAGSPRLPPDPVGCGWARPSTTSDLPPRAGPAPKTASHRKSGGASGSVNRWLRPDSVRHMSVTTAMQGLTAAQHDTQRDNSKAAREPGYAQATGRFRRWWQVLGSNQRRLSRRFYRPLPLATRATCLARPAGTGIQKNSGTGALGQHADPG